MEDETKQDSKSRHLRGFLRLIERIMLISIPILGILFILDVHVYLRLAIFKEQYAGIFIGLVLTCIFLGVPLKKGSGGIHLPWYDAILAAVSLITAAFFVYTFPSYLLSPGQGGFTYYFFGILEILLVIEATRRKAGLSLIVLTGMLIFYARFTYLFPVPFFGKGIPLDQLIIFLSFDSNGLLGVPLWVTGSIIFSFILFGEFLFATGGTQLINEFAMNTLGRFRGGPAKMAVVASGLFGTISGSAVANVMATGVITIPLMKRTGYRPEVAGAIEAAASTGGQLMPPVMGVAAFILAEFLSLPYSAVAIASIIPAILYYFAIFVQVDLEAAKHGLTGLADSSFNFWPIIKRSLLFFIPMAVLIYTLFILNFEPGKAAIIASASCFLLSLRRKDKRIGLKYFLDILEKTGKGLLMIGATAAIAGLVIGVIYTTGLGTILSTVLLKIGTQNLFIMLLVAALLCIILGMGMPTGAVYIIVAVVIAPSIIEMGVVPLAAHLFIFYFGLMSMVTPPVCFAAYAGAAIADADITRTGLHAVRFGMSAYIVAFLFVYSPALLLKGGILDILLTVAKSFVGIFFVATALTGYLFRNLGWFKRILFTLGGLALLMPPGTGIPIGTWLLNVSGTILCGMLAILEGRESKFYLKRIRSVA